jgi:hypothetical protein
MKKLIQILLGIYPIKIENNTKTDIRVMSTVKPIEPHSFNDWAIFIKQQNKFVYTK